MIICKKFFIFFKLYIIFASIRYIVKVNFLFHHFMNSFFSETIQLALEFIPI